MEIDKISAFHTAARRYCQAHSYLASGKYEEWLYRHEEAETITGQRIMSAAYIEPDNFVRDEAIDIIRIAIEHTLPQDFASLDALIAFLLTCGPSLLHERDQAKPGRQNSLLADMVVEVNAQFCDYIRQLTPEEITATKPLPFRHYMSKHEEERLWYRLRRKWNVGGRTWYPIQPLDYPPQPENVIGFQSAWFRQGVPLDALRGILLRHGIARVWEFREKLLPDWLSNIQDTHLFVPRYLGEKYWTSEKRDWILYASHEHSITIGGQWLISKIQKIWSEWEDHIYHDWKYVWPVLDE